MADDDKQKAPEATPVPPLRKMSDAAHQDVVRRVQEILKEHDVPAFLLVYMNPDSPDHVAYGWIGNNTWAVGAAEVAHKRIRRQCAGV